MILWTVAALESIYDGLNFGGKEYKEITRGHMTMLVEPAEEGYGKIVRLISPNCNDYLNPQYAPGERIRL